MSTDNVSQFLSHHDAARSTYEELTAYAARCLSDVPESLQNSAAVLREVESFFKRFIILPGSCYLPLATWALATHVFEMFMCSGMWPCNHRFAAAVRPAYSKCWKCVCVRPWRVNSVTPAVIFRISAEASPH